MIPTWAPSATIIPSLALPIAVVGTFAGIKVVRYSHGHSSNMIDRFFLGSMVAAGSHGDVKVGFSFPN